MWDTSLPQGGKGLGAGAHVAEKHAEGLADWGAAARISRSSMRRFQQET